MQSIDASNIFFSGLSPVILRELDHLITKKKPEEDDRIEDIVNKASLVDSVAIGDPAIRNLKKGDRIQLERRYENMA
jgi:hypothetical protein